MSIEVQCLQCGATHQVNDRFAGRRVRCPECDTAVHVPEMDSGDVVEVVEADIDVVEAVGVSEAVEEVEAFAEVEAVEAVETFEPVAAAETVAATAAMAVSTTSPSVAPDPMLEDDDDALPPRRPRETDELDMTPMVDVTFLLLIFFMVTAAFSLQKSIEMPRQQTDQPSTSVDEEETEDLDMVELQVDDMGSFLVMAPEWERETPGKQNLISALKEAIAGNTDGMRLVVKVHELAKLQYLVDAMDAGTIAGFSELEVQQVEDFD